MNKLSPEKIAEYKKNGVIKVSKVITKEMVEQLREAMQLQIEKHKDDPEYYLQYGRVNKGGAIIDEHLWPQNEVFKRYMLESHLAEYAAELTQSQKIQLFTDSFIMMNPWKVEAPGIDGLTGACKRNLKEASQAVHLGGVDLARSIDWENPFDLRQDRGWFPIRKQPGFKINPQKFLNSLLNTGSMIEVPGTLHHPPLALKGKQPNKGFNLVKSFKTTHRIPVLQVTLWKLRDKWLAELDIDLTSGVRHWKEVVRNHLTGGKTNPYLVNQLLAWYWGIVSFKLELSADKSG